MKKIHGSISLTDEGPPEGWGDAGAHSWKVELRYEGRTMTTPYYTGSALGEPTIADVLESLFSDESSADQDFTSWCGDYGYDEDSRRAERTYKAVKRQSKDLHRLLQDNLKVALEAADYQYDVMAKRLAAEEWT